MWAPANRTEFSIKLHQTSFSLSALLVNVWCARVDIDTYSLVGLDRKTQANTKKVIAILIYLVNENKKKYFHFWEIKLLMGVICVWCCSWRSCRNVIVSKSISIRISSAERIGNFHFWFASSSCSYCVAPKGFEKKSQRVVGASENKINFNFTSCLSLFCSHWCGPAMLSPRSRCSLHLCVFIHFLTASGGRWVLRLCFVGSRRRRLPPFMCRWWSLSETQWRQHEVFLCRYYEIFQFTSLSRETHRKYNNQRRRSRRDVFLFVKKKGISRIYSKDFLGIQTN